MVDGEAATDSFFLYDLYSVEGIDISDLSAEFTDEADFQAWLVNDYGYEM